MPYTYLLKCADGTFYGGWTQDLEQRLAAHNSGKGAKYTRGRLPVELAWSQYFADKQDAQRQEVRVKALTRQQKQDLINGKRTLALPPKKG